MNNLNSILIEGSVSEEAKFLKHKDFYLCQFAITSRRFDDSGKTLSCVHIAIEAHGNLAVICKDKAKIDTPIRIVGRLENDNSAKIYVLAEHIEFRMEYFGENDDES